LQESVDRRAKSHAPILPPATAGTCRYDHTGPCTLGPVKGKQAFFVGDGLASRQDVTGGVQVSMPA